MCVCACGYVHYLERVQAGRRQAEAALKGRTDGPCSGGVCAVVPQTGLRGDTGHNTHTTWKMANAKTMAS